MKMEIKTILIFAAFCVFQVELIDTPPDVRLTIQDYLDIRKKIDDFADTVFLTGTKCLWEKQHPKKNFSRCYNSIRQKEHKDAMADFFDKTLEAGSNLKEKSPNYYKGRAERVITSINKFGHSVIDYQKGFSEAVSQSEFKTVESLIRKYKTELEDELTKFFVEVTEIHKTTSKPDEKKEASKCEEAIQEEMKKAKDVCTEVVGKIEQCLEEK